MPHNTTEDTFRSRRRIASEHPKTTSTMMDTMPSVGIARPEPDFSSRTPVDSNITLWQFLLELLVQGEHPQLIQWTNREGEFKVGGWEFCCFAAGHAPCNVLLTQQHGL